MASTQTVTQKVNLTVVLENREKSTVKHSTEKPILLNFVDFVHNILPYIECLNLYILSTTKIQKMVWDSLLQYFLTMNIRFFVFFSFDISKV